MFAVLENAYRYSLERLWQFCDFIDNGFSVDYHPSPGLVEAMDETEYIKARLEAGDTIDAIMALYNDDEFCDDEY